MIRKKTTIAFMCLTMIVLASLDGLIGVILPSLKHEFCVKDTQMSFVLTVNSFGIIGCTFIGGKICHNFGHKKAFSLGFLMIAIAGVLMLFANNIFSFILVSFTASCGLSLATIAANSSTPTMFITSQAIFMNIFHLFYAVGGATSKKVAGLLTGSGTNWRVLYFGIALAALLLIVMLFQTNVPIAQNENKVTKVKLKALFANKMFVLYVLIVGSYLASMSATFNWLVNYIQCSFDLDINQSSTYLSAFLLLSAIGILIFTPIIHKIGNFRIVIVFSAIVITIYLMGIILGKSGLWLIAFSGLFYSVIYPTTLVCISKVFADNSSYILGIIVTLASIIDMVFNLIMGRLNDLIGIRYTYVAVPLIFIVFFLLSYVVKKEIDLKDNEKTSSLRG